jgi:hypothetical protein
VLDWLGSLTGYWIAEKNWSFARLGRRMLIIASGLFKTPLFDNLPENIIDAQKDYPPFFSERIGSLGVFARLFLHIVKPNLINAETIYQDSTLQIYTIK